MASTYSNLKFQLMATGENSGTWGNVTNVNLGTAIEEAIAGTADVTFASADVTLTLSNTNASQTARNMRLNLTGTTGAARHRQQGTGRRFAQPGTDAETGAGSGAIRPGDADGNAGTNRHACSATLTTARADAPAGHGADHLRTGVRLSR